MKTANLNIRIDPHLKNQISTYAASLHMTVTELIVIALNKELGLATTPLDEYRVREIIREEIHKASQPF